MFTPVDIGIVLTVVGALLGCTRWLSGSLAALGAKMDGIHEKSAETNKRVDRLETVSSIHGERLASLEVRRRVGGSSS